MGIVSDSLKFNSCLPIGYFNTGTLYDLLVGDAIRGYDGKWYIRGGMGAYGTGIAGWNNTYKSTFMDSLIGRTMAIYPGVESVIVDTEGVKTEGRFAVCSDELAPDVKTSDITIIPGATNDIQSIWETIRSIGNAKETNQKELTVETPFIDPATGKRMRCWLPTIVVFDSFSELMSDEEIAMMSTEGGLNDGKIKTIHMAEANKKMILIKHLRPKCERWGLMVVAAVHLGYNVVIDSFPGARPKKQNQFMKASDHLKGTSSKFPYLVRNHIETDGCSALLEPSKDPTYGLPGDSASVDLNEVTIRVVRCKNNMSGNTMPFVISQSTGLQNTMSYYHYLRTVCKYEGLPGSPQNHACAFLPEVRVSRNKIRETIQEKPEIRRALEICAHLAFVKRNWQIASRFPKLADMDPTKLYDALLKDGSIKINDILHSRGYWTTRNDGREYLSILDIAELLDKK